MQPGILSILCCSEHSFWLCHAITTNLHFWYKEKKNTSRSIYLPQCSKYAKIPLKIHENMGSQTFLFHMLNRDVYARDATRWHAFLWKQLHLSFGLPQILIQLRLFTKFGTINRALRLFCMNRSTFLDVSQIFLVASSAFATRYEGNSWEKSRLEARAVGTAEAPFTLTWIEIFENAALFLWLGLPSTEIRHENGPSSKTYAFAPGGFWSFAFQWGQKTFCRHSFLKTMMQGFLVFAF